MTLLHRIAEQAPRMAQMQRDMSRVLDALTGHARGKRTLPPELEPIFAQILDHMAELARLTRRACEALEPPPPN